MIETDTATMTTTTASAQDAPPEPGPLPSGKGSRRVRDQAWWIVATREMSVKIRDRGFLISTLVLLALILGTLGAQVAITASGEKVTVAAVGAESGTVINSAVALADRAGESVKITWKPMASDAAVKAAVLADEVDAGLQATPDGWRLIGKTDRKTTAAIWIGAAVQQSALVRNAAAAGTTPAELARGGALKYTLLAPDETPEIVTKGTTTVFGFLFYLVATLLGASLATSIVEEKQNRIVEIIASSIRLRDLLLGKIVGNTLMALAQMVVFAAVGVIGLLAMGKSDILEQITPGLGWFFLFYVVGIAVLASIFAAAGSISGRIEDITSTTTPITAVVAVVFIAGISVSGTLLTVLSFLPLTSTITMPGRIVAGDTSWWEPVASLLISLVAAGFVILVSERIYRRALMQTGGKLSMRQALKLTD
jgi:ABC-2 type transport system permease protein